MGRAGIEPATDGYEFSLTPAEVCGRPVGIGVQAL
jgi:hypothetical protein